MGKSKKLRLALAFLILTWTILAVVSFVPGLVASMTWTGEPKLQRDLSTRWIWSDLSPWPVIVGVVRDSKGDRWFTLHEGQWISFEPTKSIP